MFENPLQYGALGVLLVVLLFLLRGGSKVAAWVGRRLDQQLHSNRLLQKQIVRSVKVTGRRVEAIGAQINEANGQTLQKLEVIHKDILRGGGRTGAAS